MDLIGNLICAAHANGTHQRLALDALEDMKAADSAKWRRLFLKNVERYVEGAKAPDNTFKDFTNHVLHPRKNYWGGAPDKVTAWYRTLVDHLSAQRFEDAAYAAGVLSHYFSDPLMPLHTSKSQASDNIHRACEWSVAKSYADLRRQGEAEFGTMTIAIGAGPDWLAELVCHNADRANAYYEPLIAHYDFRIGASRPQDGLDAHGRRLIAEMLMCARRGLALVLDRAVGEAGVAPPDVTLSAEAVLSALKVPLKMVLNKMEDQAERKEVQAMFEEFAATGKVDKTMSADDRLVRDVYAVEVLKPEMDARANARAQRVARAVASAAQTPLAAVAMHSEPVRVQAVNATRVTAPIAGPVTRPEPTARSAVIHPLPSAVATAAKPVHAVPALAATTTAYLGLESALDGAPSIGPKTAERLAKVGVHKVSDLLAADPEALADSLDARHLTAQVVRDWQDEAKLVIAVPGLRNTHAQVLVGAGFRDAASLARADIASLQAAVLKFAGSHDGQRLLRNGEAPDLEKLSGWIALASMALAA